MKTIRFILFRSIHDVMKAEKALKAKEVWCDLVPVPKRISTACGMALQIHEDDIRQFLALASESDIGWIGTYKQEGAELIPMETA